MASSQASVEYFLIAGYTHGARIANDVLGLISDIIRGLDVLKQQRQVASHEPKGHREASRREVELRSMGPKDGPKPLISNQRPFRPLKLGLG